MESGQNRSETTSGQPNPVVRASGLGSTYPIEGGWIRVLRGLDLEIAPGEFVAVVGSPNSGKSTLLSLIGGLTKPTRGTVYIEDDAITRLSRWERSRVRGTSIGFLFQQPKLLPDLSILENVLLPLRYLSRRERLEGRKHAVELLERVGLTDEMSLNPRKLTEEQRYRAALARALVNHPVVLLADDPFTAFDSGEQQELMRLTHRLCREERCALLCTAKGEESVSRADRVLVLPEPEIVHEELPGNLDSEFSVASRTNQDLLSDLYEAEFGSWARWMGPFVNLVLRPAFFAAIVAIVITYLCYFGLRVAQRGAFGLPMSVGRIAVDSVGRTIEYLGRALRGDFGDCMQRTTAYYWGPSGGFPVATVLGRTVPKSAALLVLAMLLGGLVGAPLGILAALTRHRKGSLGFVALSIAGVSIPSFFLGLLLQITEIAFYKKTGIRLVPVGGFGWDNHIVLPVLVLAARPVAQVARVTYVAVAEVLEADFVRTARAKGLSSWGVLWSHVMPAAAVPVLTALGTSLRFALSSLPVVEMLFDWPGVGATLLWAISTLQVDLTVALSLTLGMVFTVVNTILEYVYTMVDPRLRSTGIRLSSRRSWVASLQGIWLGLCRIPATLKLALPWVRKDKKSLPRLINREEAAEWSAAAREREVAIRKERRRAWVQSTLGSLPFVMGAAVVILLVVASIFGPSWSPHDPHNTVASITVDGQMRLPPFPPSNTFPLGTDAQGRDILSLLLTGARRTMGLALMATLARIALGGILGAIAGWFSGSFLDRLLMSAAEVTAAFPSLLLAMVLITALGVQQGIWVFAVSLCVVSWGETTQFVRSQVMAIREKDYIEGALATGAADGEVLLRHVLPNLFPSLMVLGFLEMGSVLMMLGELGFLGIYIGGGFRTTTAADTAVVYFDVPEWGVMISNMWRRFRAYPWGTFYPALAFTISILGFNFLGEGLRRLTERLTLNLNRLFNKYTLGAALGVFLLVLAIMEGTGPWAQYKGTADSFNSERALADIEYLSYPELRGRRTGTPEIDLAAEYIAREFEQAGLQPAGEPGESGDTYYQTIPYDYCNYSTPTTLTLRDRSGELLGEMEYRRDFAEYVETASAGGVISAEIVYVAQSLEAIRWDSSALSLRADEWGGKILLGLSQRVFTDWGYFQSNIAGGVLVSVHDEQSLQRYSLPPVSRSTGGQHLSGVFWDVPVIAITPEVTNQILSRSGLSPEELMRRARDLQGNESMVVPTGVIAEMEVNTAVQERVETRNVLGFMPGVDSQLDDEAVVVVAHYDGLGVDPAGNVFPGANDNASGVAVMLEIIRLWKEQDFRPKRTVFFVAWAGAERGQVADIERFLRARLGFIGAYRIVAAVELTGVGAGSGETLLLKRSTSGRLTELFQEAGQRAGVPVNTKGEGVHDEWDTHQPDARIPRIVLTWEGSGETAHTPLDAIEGIDSEKLYDTGRMASLALMVLCREQNY